MFLRVWRRSFGNIEKEMDWERFVGGGGRWKFDDEMVSQRIWSF